MAASAAAIGLLSASSACYPSAAEGQDVAAAAVSGPSADVVEMSYEAEGKLLVREGNKTQELPLRVEGKFVFTERQPNIRASAEQTIGLPRLGLRLFRTAQSVGKVGQEEARVGLRQDRQLVAARSDLSETLIWSPTGLLTRTELDLLRPTACTLIFSELAPPKVDAPGHKWKIAPEILPLLVGWDAVATAQVEATLLEVVGDIARVEFSGSAEGAAEAMRSTASLKGRYQYSLSKRKVVWLGLACHDRRDPGPIAPGVDVILRLAVTTKTGEVVPELLEPKLLEAALNPPPDALLLEEESPGKMWRLQYDRRWHITALTPSLCVMRYVDRGTYLAQCKIAQAQASQKGTSLAKFQADIRDALGQQFRRFIHASELRSVAQTPIYRVEAQGVVGDVPVLWIFYWLGSPTGDALVLSFTLEESLYERFGEADKQLVEGFRFRVPEVASRPR